MENLRFLAPFDERFHKSKDPVIISSTGSTGSTGSVPEYDSPTNRKNVSLKTQLLFDNWNNFKEEKIRNNVDKISFANETRATTVEKNSNDFLIYLSFGLFILFIIYCVFNTDKKEYIQSTEL